MRRSMVKAMGMKAETTAGSSQAQRKTGDEAKLVLELTGVKASTSIDGTVLEKQTETVYRRTSEKTTVAFDSSTPVVMGKASDIHDGAVVHVTAKMAGDRTLHAEQIVILTGYVKVQYIDAQ
jgi:hypothetical protein